MTELWRILFIWLGLALLSSLISLRLGISGVIAEIIVGIIVGNLFYIPITEWINLFANFGAIIIAFLAGAELESGTIKTYWKSAIVIGISGFLPALLGTGILAYFILKWSIKQSILAGTALSSISIAIVYALLIETNLNEKKIGKLLLASSFINGLGTLLILTILFVKIDRTFWIFLFVTLVLFILLPPFTRAYNFYVKNHHSEPEVKFIFFILAFLAFISGLIIFIKYLKFYLRL